MYCARQISETLNYMTNMRKYINVYTTYLYILKINSA